MSVVVEIPESLRKALARERDEQTLPRWALEAMVAEPVRQELITEGFAGRVLGLSFDERELFLAKHGIVHDEDVDELRKQQKVFERAEQKP